MAISSITHLTSAKVAELDPYAFLVVIGKRVIHAGGHRSSPFEMMTLAGFVSDEGVVNYLGYLLVVGQKPVSVQA
jgi:hypothetical protein